MYINDDSDTIEIKTGRFAKRVRDSERVKLAINHSRDAYYPLWLSLGTICDNLDL